MFLFLLRTSAKIKQAYLCARFGVGFRFIYNLVILQFSSLRLAFEKSDSLRGFESPLLQEGQGGGFPFSSLRLAFWSGAMQVARCLQAPLLRRGGGEASPFPRFALLRVGSDAGRAMSAGSSPLGEAGERLPLISDAKVRNPTNRCTKNVKECKRVQQSAK